MNIANVKSVTGVLASTALTFLAHTALAGDVMTTYRKAVLLDDFVSALEVHAGIAEKESLSPAQTLWVDGMRKYGVDPQFLARRFQKARNRDLESGDIFARYRTIKVESLPALAETESTTDPVALHAFRLDVVEDYDDHTNDDIYLYFITTHDDLLWGKITGIYRGLDEGNQVFLTAEDRGLFGPKGEKIAPRNHTIVDVGIIESDGDDVTQLKRVSDAIVDLALVALSIYDPQAGAAAAQARAEVKNLLHLIVELDTDDRLATDSVHFTPDQMQGLFQGGTVHEFSRYYEHETFWTHYAYRLNFRLLR